MSRGFIFIIIFSIGCREKSKSNIPAGTSAINDTTHFFLVADYIDSQINEVNKTPYFIYMLTTRNGATDSVAINTKQFTLAAKEFTMSDINDPALKKFYSEDVFFDQTTKSYTLNYSTSNKDLPVQNISVLLYEDGVTVKRIFIRRFINYKDSTAIEQLSWKPDDNFQVSRVVQKAGVKESIYTTKVVWYDKR